MPQETGDTIRQYKAAMERIRSGESRSEEVELPSGRVLLTPDPNTPSGIAIEVMESDRTAGSQEPRDPGMVEAMERIKEAIGRFKSGELDSVEIPLPSGETMELVRDERSPGAFTVGTPDGGLGMVSIPFDASPTPPEGYPEELPFLPETAVGLTEIEGQGYRTLTWLISHDPEESLKSLRLRLSRDGWEAQEESNATTAFGTMTSIEFRKGSESRTVVLNRFGEHAQLRLIEHPRK